MEYVTLNNGVQLPMIGFGTWDVRGEAGKKTILTALDSGYRLIDTGQMYENEDIVGQAVKESGLERKEVFLTTKLYRPCVTYEKAKAAIEKSLQALQTDYIDLYLVHWPDPNVSMEETIGAVAQLKKEGKILHAGVSNFTKEQIEEAGKYCEIEAYQPQYSMLDGDNEAVIRWAAAQGMGIMSYGTLGGGILTGTYREVRTFGETDNRNRFYPYFREPLFSKVMELLEVMDAIAAERGVPLAQIAVNWTLQQPFITSCIAGAQSRKKVEENCAGLEWQLTEDEMHRLDQAIQRYQFSVQCGEVYQRR